MKAWWSAGKGCHRPDTWEPCWQRRILQTKSLFPVELFWPNLQKYNTPKERKPVQSQFALHSTADWAPTVQICFPISVVFEQHVKLHDPTRLITYSVTLVIPLNFWPCSDRAKIICRRRESWMMASGASKVCLLCIPFFFHVLCGPVHQKNIWHTIYHQEP